MIVCLPIVDERVHEKSFFDRRSESLVLVGQVSVGVVRHDDTVVLRRQLHDVPIVVARDPSAADRPRRRKHHDILAFQFEQYLLVWKRRKTN